MIQSISDLLDVIKKAEVEKIDALKIKHRPTIGNTYEGLTQELLGKAIFKGLDLNIVTNSFIKLDNGERSDEYDIMIIEGCGQKILYTKDQYDVKYEQVIAVIQVKKSINKQQILEAYYNLKNVYDILDMEVAPDYTLKLFSDSYKSICGENIVEKGKFRKTFSSSTHEHIFHMLKLESILPARIVFGYEGYKSEYSFREGFMKFLKDNKSSEDDLKYGFGPINFPDLIINGEYTLIKGNAMPYIGNMEDGQWNFYVSSPVSPIYKLLEILWTRLSYRFKLSSSIFGDDLELESVHYFLKCNIVNVNGFRGWNFEYTPLSKKVLEKEYDVEEWQPAKLTMEQHSVIWYLCEKGVLRIDQINNLLSNPVDEKLFSQDLTKTGLVYIDRHELKLLTEACRCLILPDGNYYAADDKTGKLTRWAIRKMEELKKNVTPVPTKSPRSRPDC